MLAIGIAILEQEGVQFRALRAYAADHFISLARIQFETEIALYAGAQQLGVAGRQSQSAYDGVEAFPGFDAAG